jgi:hypothetical protein
MMPNFGPGSEVGESEDGGQALKLESGSERRYETVALRLKLQVTSSFTACGF